MARWERTGAAWNAQSPGMPNGRYAQLSPFQNEADPGNQQEALTRALGSGTATRTGPTLSRSPGEYVPDTPGAGASTGSSAAAQLVGPYTGSMLGFDWTKLQDPAHQTMKYQVGRILSQFPATVDGLNQAWSQIQAAFPQATRIGDDKINFHDGGGAVDILQAASEGGRNWQWLGDQDTGQTGTGVDRDANSQAMIDYLTQRLALNKSLFSQLGL